MVKKKKLNYGKILFIVFVVLLGFVSLKSFLYPNNIDSENEISLATSSLSRKVIGEIIKDDNFNLEVELISFDPVLEIVDQEKKFPISDFFYIVGKITNLNENDINCDIVSNIKFDDIINDYYDNIFIESESVKGFELLIELPGGESDIDFSYDCKFVE
jgi:hypothetical protein